MRGGVFLTSCKNVADGGASSGGGGWSADSIGIKMVSIPTKNIVMADSEITQAQWQAIMGDNPSHFQDNPASGEVQANRPVEKVSWYDALVYCNTLSMKENRTPCYKIGDSTDPSVWMASLSGAPPTSSNPTWDSVTCDSNANGYRLPTKDEWEFAAKGGSATNKWAGTNVEGELTNYAWYIDNSNSKTHEVKKKAPNGYRIYDMSGNVWEWCWDWYTSGSKRVECGGGYSNAAASCAVSIRDNDTPNYRGSDRGFRVVRGQ